MYGQKNFFKYNLPTGIGAIINYQNPNNAAVTFLYFAVLIKNKFLFVIYGSKMPYNSLSGAALYRAV